MAKDGVWIRFLKSYFNPPPSFEQGDEVPVVQMDHESRMSGRHNTMLQSRIADQEMFRMYHGLEGQLIQIKKPHRWGLCFAVIDETKVFGCQAYVLVPNNLMEEPDQAFIRLNRDEYELLHVYVDVETRLVTDGIDRGD